MKTKIKWVYLVYCNPSPRTLVYGVFSAKKSALKYAYQLLKWREDNAKENKYEFGYYHQMFEDKRSETDFDKREKYILSMCLKVKDNLKTMSDDACLIQVVRRPLIK